MIKIILFFLILSSITFGQKLIFMDDAAAITPVYSCDFNYTDENGDKASPTGIDIGSSGTLTVLAWVNTPDAAHYRTIAGQRATNGWVFGIFNDGDLASAIRGADANQGILQNNGVAVDDGAWHLVGMTIKAARDSNIYWIDGTRYALNTTDPGDIDNAANLTIGYSAALGYMEDETGQLQIIVGYEPTTAEVLDAYNLGGVLPSSYGGGTIVSWYKWAGDDDATFLSDTQGNNNLTGTNLTQADDQVEYAGGVYE